MKNLFIASVLVIVGGCDVPTSVTPQSSGGVVVEVYDVHIEDNYVVGYVENKTRHAGWFTIQFSLYDSTGARVGTASDTISDIADERWKFKAYSFDHDASVYRFDGVSCKWGQVATTYRTRAESERATAALTNPPESVQARHQRELQEKRAREAVEADQKLQELQRVQSAAERYRQKQVATTLRVVAHQHQQASNGYGGFQYELGRRYLKGDGVETNRILALHWLTSACTNGLSEATNLLGQINL